MDILPKSPRKTYKFKCIITSHSCIHSLHLYSTGDKLVFYCAWPVLCGLKKNPQKYQTSNKPKPFFLMHYVSLNFFSLNIPCMRVLIVWFCFVENTILPLAWFYNSSALFIVSLKQISTFHAQLAPSYHLHSYTYKETPEKHQGCLSYHWKVSKSHNQTLGM